MDPEIKAPHIKNPFAVGMANLRASKLSRERKSEIARMAVTARWAKKFTDTKYETDHDQELTPQP